MDDALTIWFVGAAVNGLVTFGMVKAALHFLADGVREAKASAMHAHERIDAVIFDRAHRRVTPRVGGTD